MIPEQLRDTIYDGLAACGLDDAPDEMRRDARAAAEILTVEVIELRDSLNRMTRRAFNQHRRAEHAEAALWAINQIDDGHWGEGPSTARSKVHEMSRIAFEALKKMDEPGISED